MGTTAEELRNEIDQQRADLTRDFDMIGDKVSPSRIVERRTEAVKGRARRIRDAVMGTADDMSSAARDRLGSARDTAGGVTGGVGEMVSDAPHRIEEGARGNPLVAGGIAFGFGLLIATVLPPSRRERELARQVQPQLEHAAESALETGKEVAEELKPAVQQAGSQLGEATQAAAASIQQTAQDHVTSASETAQQAAADMKDRASSD
jgi:gas vesicle protein